MAIIFIGETTRGVAIVVETNARQIADLSSIFALFSERDKFDALMALEYPAVSELRKSSGDEPWLDAIGFTHSYLKMALGEQVVALWSERLGLTSAFAARDYGKVLVRRPFRHI